MPGEDGLIGAGIHFCATCDAAFYRNSEHILVIGGGNSAGEESLFLTKFAKKVTIVTNAPELTASEIVKQKVAETPQIEVIGDSTVAEFKGGKRVKSVVIKNVKSGETRELHPAGVFVFIGLTPNTKFLDAASGIVLDKAGFIETNAMLETSVPGVFAAGDVRLGSTSAAGEGATAALMVRNYLKESAEAQNVRAA